ncbi:hypothetical protein CcCBS67573_g09341 [Chytriomyces confervae]|uniref:Uncharacterized protein n=1 Tax=Chytriomyces confervae TaxID=246404 RepID=A0A507DZD9_9FUNG|nr:hypothetical protein CcCBS67573_g09341 [Chytriomyces confervae]
MFDALKQYIDVVDSHLIAKIVNTTNDPNNKEYLRRLEELTAIRAISFISRISTPTFELLLGANLALIGFTNGIYDLDAKEFRERPTPADYITMSCNATTTMNLLFALSIQSSHIKNAGFGVFVRPLARATFPHIIKQGTIVALYLGVVYSPADLRMDSSMIDGKHSGLSKYIFKSIWKRELAWNRITYDRGWLDLRKQGDCLSWSVGQLINNALNSATDANVVYNEFTLDLSFPAEYRAFIPNVPYAPEEADIHGIALVTTQDLVFEKMDQQVELLASYQSVHHGG